MHEDVCGTDNGKLSGSNGIHRDTTTKTVCDKQGVLVTVLGDRRGGRGRRAKSPRQHHRAGAYQSRAIGQLPVDFSVPDT